MTFNVPEATSVRAWYTVTSRNTRGVKINLVLLVYCYIATEKAPKHISESPVTLKIREKLENDFHIFQTV